ncbi:MAG: pyruvate dehydrogenase (acetyl-transferring), homodimeric type [Planctomycetota bacterium]|nr:MAG: pyruvate dehydrogenase (acetyl-transferring), homodimeric type [Planctomycetota bacterium]
MSYPYMPDADPVETREWLESLEAVVGAQGPERAQFLLTALHDWARTRGVAVPFNANTPYVNTIPVNRQPPYPGDRAIERRLKSYMRWNAMALVVRANRRSPGIGGHISTYASAATLLEVGFNHFFRANTPERTGDQIYFQGHCAPGIYARAYLEGRLTTARLHNFRRELSEGGGLSSYPHPWLMPDFWEFPTVSMGLGPLSAIYQARFNRYLNDRGLAKTDHCRVWAFLGDGEMDEPESMGAITLASREGLDNLIFVVNCNLQRLDGPVRGNGSIIQELEAAFRGAGWNAIKVVWGGDWDPLFERDTDNLLPARMAGVVDGQWQKYSVSPGSYIREHFFGTDPRLAALVQDLSDKQLEKLRLGGHDPQKVYAAYSAAVENTGRPTVILARTIKGYGLGEAGEGKNITHQQKKLNEQELKEFRDRFEIPISDRELRDAPFYRPPAGSPEERYIQERRAALGGFVPRRMVRAKPLDAVSEKVFEEFFKGSAGRPASTTMVFVRLLSRLLDDPKIGDLIVPIVPDESRTFGMEALFQKHGIYAHSGQKYEPVDRQSLMYYREETDGQLLQEGITEAGSMASFTAAGTAYVTHGINTIPFFTFYSMFGFQRVGDSIWAHGDIRGKGFLMGATSGRTTLAGEGLQHQDGHSLLHATTVPNCLAYDPAFAYELAIIIREGIRRMYEKHEDIFYYIAICNEPYEMPPIPDGEGVAEGVLKGFYLYKPGERKRNWPRVHLFGSGAILNEALRAQAMLAERFKVSADVWSVTSYQQLRREALMVDRWNRLHPAARPKKSYFARQMEADPHPIIASSDYLKLVAEQVAPWAPAEFVALGTDGFGRSEAREDLRRFFEVDAESICVATLNTLAQRGEIVASVAEEAIREFGIDPERPEPARS